jgi:hypothetical protein
VSGLHCESNLQYLPIPENRSKSRKHDPDAHEHQVPIWLEDMVFIYG